MRVQLQNCEIAGLLCQQRTIKAWLRIFSKELDNMYDIWLISMFSLTKKSVNHSLFFLLLLRTKEGPVLEKANHLALELVQGRLAVSHCI